MVPPNASTVQRGHFQRGEWFGYIRLHAAKRDLREDDQQHHVDHAVLIGNERGDE